MYYSNHRFADAFRNHRYPVRRRPIIEWAKAHRPPRQEAPAQRQAA